MGLAVRKMNFQDLTPVVDFCTARVYTIDTLTSIRMEVPEVARPWRVEYPGAMHHVTAHAVAGQDLFLVDGDRHKFISLLADVHRRWGTVVHGYCLMSNHYHLEVETPDGALSQPIKWLNQTYASYLNCCLLYTSPSPRDRTRSRMPSSA